MLAERREITTLQTSIRTPLLVPSFSSKGFPEIRKILDLCLEAALTDSLMVSAYDVAKGLITLPDVTVDALFVDSGGYESSKDVELSDLGYTIGSPGEWSREDYRETVATLTSPSPVILICYDHPRDRCSIADQINRAKEDFDRVGDFARGLLLKPTSSTAYRVDCDEVVRLIHRCIDFDVLGFTEKELGNSLLERMTNVAKVRRALRSAGMQTPIHVFGGLDPVSSPLYFLVGADIFDGLAWLRFAFVDGSAIYKHNYSALRLGIATKDHLVDAQSWTSNIRYLVNLQLTMGRFLLDHDFSVFESQADFFRSAYETVVEIVGED
jgi:hypothetical protein